MKIAPIISELAARPEEFAHVLVHTGQHYDDAMSQIFFDELGVGVPDYHLNVGSGPHGIQTARIMEGLEPVLVEESPDVVLIPGDVNSTLAAAIVAAKLRIPIGHIEAGLRSFDRSMPEEINRIVTDQLSDLLFIHSPECVDNLMREGCAEERIHSVGNTMIDTLVRMQDRIAAQSAHNNYGVSLGEYLVVTLHRPALVDGPLLADVFDQLDALSDQFKVIFPAHPRTRGAMAALNIADRSDRIHLLDPVGYLEFLSLVMSSAGVITDSGGIQEETTFLGIPCFTLRDNTERPVTVSQGTNELLGLDPAALASVPTRLAARANRSSSVPEGWDGDAARRLVDVLAGVDCGALHDSALALAQ